MISPDGRFAGTIKCGDKELVFGKKTFVMGILNVTPDSFSDGGMYDTPEKALEHAKEMVEQGADIIDVGGESTRPGYTPVTTDVEKERVIPAIELIRRELDALTMDEIEKEFGIPIVNKRISITPVAIACESCAAEDYTVFAQVFDGMDVVNDIAQVDTDMRDKPTSDVVLESIEVYPYE